MGLYDKIFPLSEIPDRVRLVLSRSRSVKSLSARFARELSAEKWIFMVGCYNSGTTLIHNIMAKHPDIGGLTTEGVELTDDLLRPELFGWTRMWHKCLDDMLISPGPESAEKAARVRRQWSWWYPKGKKYIVEKSIANTTRMEFLQEHFQPAYFIYILRNGYAVSEEIRRLANVPKWNNPVYKDRYPIELCARQWKATDDLVEQTKDRIERFLTVTYEDFVEDQKHVMDRITDFLEIEQVPEEAYKAPIKVHRKTSGIRNMNQQAIDRLSREDIEKITQIAGSTLEKHGYSIL